MATFAEQWYRLFLTWKARAGIKTRRELFEQLEITELDYLHAAKEDVMPKEWLEKTANSLRIDVTYIKTGVAKNN